MDYRDVPAFVAKLRECDTIAAMALEFCLLTAARSAEVYGARWSEIDMAAKVWILPAERMKGPGTSIPLSSARSTWKGCALEDGDYVFSSPRVKAALSRGDGESDAPVKIDGPTVHGFRSAFRDWAGNETHFAREVAEAALAHVIGDAAERAYRRATRSKSAVR